jgi:prepilin-type N-terminal cleavage/methylation domain-containing protein
MMPSIPTPRVTCTGRRHLIGFTLVEVIVALAIVLILAAVALPNVTGYLDQKRIDETVIQLTTVRDALYNPAGGAVAFRQMVGSNAGRLSDLDSVIVNGSALWDDSCGNNYTNGERNNWIANGPFMTYNSERNVGMMTPVGMVNDVLTRIPPNNPPNVNATLRLTWNNNVSLADAQLLDATIEGGNGFNVGILQWTPAAPASGIVTMTYDVFVNATC